MMDFTESQLHRYGRQIILPQIGGVGQEKLLKAKVLVIGAGGLGSPAIFYLAAAGIGHIGIIDDDQIELGNLQRQILYSNDQVGRSKAECAAERALALNPDLTITPYKKRLDEHNIRTIIADYDIIADASDNFATRFLVNDCCHELGKVLVSAAVIRFEGQLTTFKPQGPCYRCIFGAAPPDGDQQACSRAGVLGAVAGVMGSLQATEIVKEITGIGQSLSGRLMIYDALAQNFRTLTVKQDPGCPTCQI